MEKRFLLTSTQYPGNGGAATNIYKINKYLLNNKIKVCCIYFLCKEDLDKIKIDPDNLNNIFYIRTCWKDGSLSYFEKETGNYIPYNEEYINDFREKINNYLEGEPNIILSKNYRAPISSKILFPEAKLYYLVSGVRFLSILNNEHKDDISSQKYINNKDRYNDIVKKYIEDKSIIQEINTLKLVDGIIYNSILAKKLMKHFYDKYYEDINLLKNEFIINTSNLNIIDIFKNDKRFFDIIYVCSDFNRKIKNSKFINEILSDKRLNKYRKIVIGDNNIFNRKIKNIHIYDQQPNQIVLFFMKNSKLLLMPSLFDASPNVLYESIKCGCNFIISKNVGNCEQFNKDNICNDVFSKEEWVKKILTNINKKPVLNKLKNDLLEKLMDL